MQSRSPTSATSAAAPLSREVGDGDEENRRLILKQDDCNGHEMFRVFWISILGEVPVWFEIHQQALFMGALLGLQGG